MALLSRFSSVNDANDGFRSSFRFTSLTSLIPFTSLALFCFSLVFLACAAASVSGDSQSSASLDVVGTSNVTITAFTIVPSLIYEGGSAEFSVSAENRGNLEDSLSVNVSIRDSLGAEVYVVNYTPLNITPGSVATLTATWSSAGFAVGTYSANATGTYNGGANYTNSLAGNFSVVSAAVPTPPRIGVGVVPSPFASPAASPEAAVRPTTIPPTLKPVEGAVRFTRKTVLQEVVAGEGALLTLHFKNTAREAVAARIVFAGLPAGTPPVEPQRVFLQPGASSTFDFALWIPERALPGDYVVKTSVVDEESGEETTKDYFFLRVKSYPKNYENPIVLRRVSLDTDARTTNVVLNVRNPSLRTLDVVDVIEVIPTPLAATQNDVLFLDKIGSYLADKPLTLAWRLTDVAPDEKSVITYSINTLSDDYAVYGSWFTKQVSTSRPLRLADIVTITSFSIQGVQPGDRTTASFTVFYGGIAPLQVAAGLDLPPGFKAFPQTIRNVVLAPRTTQDFEFEVEADSSVAVGAYSARAMVLALNEEVSAVSAIIVLPVFFGVAWFPAALAVFALVVVLLVAFFALRKRGVGGEAPLFDRERVNYAESLRRIIFGEEKG